jgi:hypothetical protein
MLLTTEFSLDVETAFYFGDYRKQDIQSFQDLASPKSDLAHLNFPKMSGIEL